MNIRANPQNLPKTRSKSFDFDALIDSFVGWIEGFLGIVKFFLLVSGIVLADMADVVMGSVSIAILFGGAGVSVLLGVPAWVIGAMISGAMSALQIILWSVIRRNGYGFKDIILGFDKLPDTIKGTLLIAGFAWALDTIMDVAPVFLLTAGSEYSKIPLLFDILKIVILLMVFILCGFAEMVTSNFKEVISLSKDDKKQSQVNNNKSSYRNPSQQAFMPLPYNNSNREPNEIPFKGAKPSQPFIKKNVPPINTSKVERERSRQPEIEDFRSLLGKQLSPNLNYNETDDDE